MTNQNSVVMRSVDDPRAKRSLLEFSLFLAKMCVCISVIKWKIACKLSIEDICNVDPIIVFVAQCWIRNYSVETIGNLPSFSLQKKKNFSKEKDNFKFVTFSFLAKWLHHT